MKAALVETDFMEMISSMKRLQQCAVQLNMTEHFISQSYLSQSRSESLREVNVKKLSDGYDLA